MIDPLINLIAEDNEVIPYRKSLRPITGSVTATILLQQMLFRSNGGKKAFYKFKAPCDHDLYKEGDSWVEEIGFSTREFDTALKKIGTKIKTGMSKADIMNGITPDCLIAYWTGRDRVTWYEVNVDLLSKLLNGIYLNDKSAFTRKTTKAHLDKDSETPSETTPEIKEGTPIPPKKPSKPNSRKKKPKDPPPPAVKVHQELNENKLPKKLLWPIIAAAVGEKPEDLELWRQVIVGYVAKGWYINNISTQLEYFERREIPGKNRNGARNNGSQKSSSQTGQTGQDLDKLPTVNPYTGETIAPRLP